MSVGTRKPPPATMTANDRSSVVVERIRPSARCHTCGEGVVDAVCSTCAQLLCRSHALAAGPLGPRAVLQLFRTDPAADGEPAVRKKVKKRTTFARPGRSSTAAPSVPDDQKPDDGKQEPDEPGSGDGGKPDGDDRERHAGEQLGVRPRGSAHRRFCPRCAPRARPLDAELIAGTTTVALGAAVFPVQSVVGGLLLGVGGVRVAARTLIGLRQRTRSGRYRRADLALNPNLRKIKTRERITGTVRLRPDRRWETTVDEVSGSVAVEGNWSRVHRAVVDRHRRSTGSFPTSVAAGHLVLHGPGRVVFRSAADARVNGGPALVLEPRVADQPLLSSVNGLGETRWHPTFRYDVTPPKHGWRTPIWISPNIAADLDRHVLELHIQWNTHGPETTDAGVPLQTIEVLEMAVPAHWGTVEFMTKLDGVTLSGQPEAGRDGGPAQRKLTWKKISFKDRADRGVVRLTVRFSERIDFDYELTGRIEARFTGAVSGLTRTVVYRTDGNPVPRLDGMLKPITVADVGFTLSLAGLRYQEQRAVPDRGRAEDVARRETEPFPGIVPDHRTVALLTNHLADEGYSIIRIQENPAQSSPRPGAVNRLWDLAGRHYEGVYPIEFHLQLSGEEIHKGQQISGDTTVTLTVHGSYANAEMEARVVEQWTRLWKRIRLSLAGAGDGPRLAEQPLDAASSELARLRNVALTEIDRLRAAADAGRIDPDLARETIDRIAREFGLDEG